MNRIRTALQLTTTFTRIEFWAFTTIYAFGMFFFFMPGFDHWAPSHIESFREAAFPFQFYRNYFVPQLLRDAALYLGLICLNFILVPKLVKEQNRAGNAVRAVLVFVLLGANYGLTDYYLREVFYGAAGSASVETMAGTGLKYAGMVALVFFIYSVIKYTSLRLLAVSEKLEAAWPFIRREGIVASFIWAVFLLLLISQDAPGLAIAGWVIAAPSAILLYLAGFYTLIPSSLTKKYPFLLYAAKNALILFLIFMAWGLIVKLVVGGVLGGDKAPLAALWVFNSVLQLFITVPVTWWLYQRHLKGNEELRLLKKELGRSAAGFDFLRSQINPHFLFNALNTLYGTALQEGAERTGEGVQKLGDMMRFMLQENMQDSISLDREIDYLNNYISLQKLRTGAVPGIRIETDIQEGDTGLPIAPMLLIPFVENAFKHGISFRELSCIKISLAIKEGSLYFDVFNLKHVRPERDPEGGKSGIGLENVKQRLRLVYPGRHQLDIRDTAGDFSVHLVIQLAKSRKLTV